MIRLSRIHRASAATLGAAVLAVAALAAAAPATAGHAATEAAQRPAVSSTSWRVVTARHFGRTRNHSAFEAVVSHASDAWFLGGTNVGGYSSPLVEHRVLGQWQLASLPRGLRGWIVAASAASAKSVWAITNLGVVLHWNSAQWSVARGGGWLRGRQFTGMTAITDSDVWVFGAASGTHHGAGTWRFNGTSWTRFRGNAGSISRANAISASSIWAIDGNAVVHFNGATWRLEGNRALAGMQFTAIRAETDTDIWVAGSAVQHGVRRPKLVHWNGTHWTRIAMPGTAIPSSLSADGHGGIWAVANSGRISTAAERSSLGSWRSTRIGTNPQRQLSAIAIIPGTTSIWGGGRSRRASGSNAAIYGFGPAL